ncbi:MAG: quinone-dependent dihydroorotate dehydrogenase [Sphingobacteriaceae bacterium]|nr:quinone-dependent dihydroorotate dehydrogenase [Sphingobacteriaceae bacterium]
MFKLIRSILFMLPPERAHYVTMHLLQFFCRFLLTAWIFKLLYRRVKDPVEVAGIRFPNRVGLAAGFDKDARFMDVFKALGFGHMEIGTVTPLPQPGNDQPRLFRLPVDQALINRLGFNNKGVDYAVEKLKNRPKGLVIGGNIGKNKVTPNELAAQDYEICFEKLHPYVDYFTVNVSSPNTPNLRELQEKEPLTALLMRLQALNAAKAQPKPIFLKIAPDLTEGQVDDIVDIVVASQIQGVVATNTTISRADLRSDAATIEAIGAGGLSGKPAFEPSTRLLRQLQSKAAGRFPIIGVGGVMTAADAQAKFEAGASLVQLYTGFVYAGPALVKAIAKQGRKLSK